MTTKFNSSALQAPAQFGRWFKNAAGMSPGEFRQGFPHTDRASD